MKVHISSVALGLSLALPLVIGGTAQASPGEIDGSFGFGGFATAFGVSNTAYMQSTDLANGYVVGVGIFSQTGGTGSLALARWVESSGELDSTFGAGGTVVTVADYPQDATVLANAAVVDSASNVNVVGQWCLSNSLSCGNGSYAFFIRVNANGTVGTTKTISSPFGPSGTPLTLTNIALDPLNTSYYYVAGTIYVQAYQTYFAVVGRINSAGVGDPTFGSSNGFALIGVGSASGLVVQPNTGKPVLAVIQSTGSNFITRLTYAGGTDSTFGSSGHTNVALNFPSNQALALYPSTSPSHANYILAYGDTDNAALVRLTANGSLDTSFGTGGVAVSTYSFTGTSGATPSGPSYTSAATVGPSDDVVMAIAQPLDDGNTQAALSRFTASGALDKTFGGGFVYFDATPEPWYGFNALRIDASSKIVAGIGWAAWNTQGFVATRYLWD